MTGNQFRKCLDRLELSQVEAARRMYVTTTTVFRWASEARKVPGPVVALLECWEKQRRLRDTLGDQPARSKKRRKGKKK